LPNIDILVLAVVQGITEFLPVSSSGHLILVPKLFCWSDQGLTLDVAAHVGTLLAVLVYFWRDVANMTAGFGSLLQRKRDARAHLIGLLIVGALPALFIGYGLDRWAGDALRSTAVIATALIVFGVALYLADRLGLTVRRLEHMGYGHAFLIGLLQCIAFIPGTSRSGITMTMARLLGYERLDAARFSFLLSIPTIAAAGLYKGYHLASEGSLAEIQRALMMMGFSAVAGFFAIAFMMYWLRRANFALFVVYRLILGGLLFYALAADWQPSCS
jgi:undecaprenyl-diphosphatase